MAQLDDAKSPAMLSEKWVSIAAALGLALAIWSALGAPLPSFEGGEAAIAYVNDVPITQEEYARALEAIRADATHTLTQQDKQRALDVLIREELLVQRAEQMGIVKTDRTIRKAIVDAMMISIRTEERASEPTDAELDEFLAKAPGFFQKPAALTLMAARAPTPEGAVALEKALRAGTPFEDAVKSAKAIILPLPGGALALSKVQDYLGPTLTARIAAQNAGDIVGPVHTPNGSYFVWVLAREESTSKSTEEQRPILAKEWRRRREVEAVLAYFARLKQAASIQVLDGSLHD